MGITKGKKTEKIKTEKPKIEKPKKVKPVKTQKSKPDKVKKDKADKVQKKKTVKEQKRKTVKIQDIKNKQEKAEKKLDLKLDFNTDSKPDYKPDFVPIQKPDYKPGFMPIQRPEYKPDLKQDYRPDIKPDYKPGIKPELDFEEESKPIPKVLKMVLIYLVIMLFLILLTLVIKYEFSITSVKVVGNEHYSAREIENMVLNGSHGRNSIFLYLKYRNRKKEDIPFIEQMDVELISPTSVRIQVYEKAIAGYVEYLGHYLYFDKDGIVVESSTEQIEGIPFVTGLHFDHVILHEKLPVENDEIFRLILNITQLLTKYNIATDRIYFDALENITLYFGDARVYLGTNEYIDEKINKLQYLLPKMQDLSGVLYMDKYKGEGGKFTFEKDKKGEIISEEDEDNTDDEDSSQNKAE